MLRLRLSKIVFLATTFLLLFATNLDAYQCSRRVFNITVNDMVTIDEILSKLSSDCSFSVVTTDSVAKKTLEQSMSGININNLTLGQIFNVLLKDNNLNYQFTGNILKISALSTKVFKVDYITSVREGTAVTKANVDSAPVAFGSGSGGGSGNSNNDGSDNSIKTVEKFNFWDKISAELKSVLNTGMETFVAPDPIVNPNAGLVTVTGTPSQLKRVANYIKDIQNNLKRQVLLDVSIISVELTNDYSTGVDWSKFQLGFGSQLPDGLTTANTFMNYIINADNNTRDSWQSKSMKGSGIFTINAALHFNIAGMMNFLETKGKTKVISSPKVMAMNNQQALITVGDNINYNLLSKQESGSNSGIAGNDKETKEYKAYSTFVGVLLNILPQISDDNKIMLRINPSLSDFKYAEDNSYQSGRDRENAPDTIQKKLSTVVEVNDGDTVILGGLIGQKKGKQNNSVPLLSVIPIVGNLFKSSKDVLSTTELIFVVTPHIVNTSSPEQLKDSLRALGYSKSTYGNIQ